MTKEELQARLQELNERQAQENRRNMETIGSLIEAYEHGKQDLADRLRDSKMEETLRHKAANLDIDCERQRLFAEYKTQREQERGATASKTEADNE